MKRFLLVAGATLAAVLAIGPASALAQAVELGATSTPLSKPVCPTTGTCPIILTETTALEVLSTGVPYPSTATHAGRIVAFTVTPASVTLADINGTKATKTTPAQPGLNATYGGVSSVAITVLKPTPALTSTKTAPGQRFWKVVAESPLFKLQPYFGHLVQFVLNQTLPIAKGDVVALTVPTWAPLLSVNLTKSQFGWRASRGSANNGCLSYTVQSAQLLVGASTQYGCYFNATRVDYTATEITSPVPPPQPKPPKKKKTKRHATKKHATQKG
jgi:hypothetical protein